MNLFSTKSSTHAIELLKRDHREVEALYAKYKSASAKDDKIRLVTQICQALTVHAEIEEKAFYPEALRALGKGGADLIEEAAVEHATLKGLIQRLDGMGPSQDLFGAYVKVLMEYVKHHVKEEESEMFPKLEKTDLDLEAVGQRLQALKDTLLATVARAPKPSRSSVSVVQPGARSARLPSIRRSSTPRARSAA